MRKPLRKRGKARSLVITPLGRDILRRIARGAYIYWKRGVDYRPAAIREKR